MLNNDIDTQRGGPDTGVDNIRLIQVNDAIRSTSVEQVGKKLRTYMGAMKPIF